MMLMNVGWAESGDSVVGGCFGFTWVAVSGSSKQ